MDDFNVGGSGGMGGMSGAPPPEEDFSKLPIEERLKSKLWKARVSAYEDLNRQFSRSASEKDAVFRPYTRNPDVVKAMATDSNAVAQEKGTEAIRTFVEFGGKEAGSTRESVLPSLVEKCLGSMRAGTKKAALEATLFYVENEDVAGSEGVVADLIKGTEAKQPKVVLAAVTALKESIRLFGPKQVRPKPILTKLKDLFAHSDKGVRSEAGLLAVELHRWIGAALTPTLNELKEIQAKELKAQFEAAGDSYTTPERHLLSNKAAAAAAAEAANGGNGDGEGADGGGEAPEAEPVDPLEFAEPQDPLKHADFPSNFDELLASKKWQERKEAVDGLLKALQSIPKVLATPSLDGPIDALIEKIKKDVNINVALGSCQALTLLAKGMRENFAKYKDRALPALLEKLKEKKESSVKIITETLDALFLTVSLSDILEDTLAASKHKNPAIKTEAIRFLARCLAETRSMPAKGDLKPIAEALMGAMDDSSPDVRDAGAQGLGTLMKLIGERPMNQFIDALDDIKKGKVQDQFKVATVKVKTSKPAAAAPARAAPAASASAPPKPRLAPPKKPAPANKENMPPAGSEASAPSSSRGPTAPVAKPPARLMAKKPAAAAVPLKAAPKAAPGKAASKGAAASATEPVKFRIHPDDADTRAADLIPEAIRGMLASSNWKERLQGMEDFNTWLGVEAAEVECEVIVRALGKKPGWKESNFQVNAEVFKALRTLANEATSFGRSTIALSVQPLCDKLGDIKLKGPAGETLALFAEKTSFGFVLAQAMGPLSNLKAPKAIADSLLWIDQALLDFGTQGVDIRSLIDFLVTCLKSANAAVRTNATQVTGTLARFVGAALNNFLGDLSPQLRTIVEGEIGKAGGNPPPAPTRFSDELQVKTQGATSHSGAGEAAGAAADEDDQEDALEALVPRVDIDKIVPSDAIALLSSAIWKERKEGLDTIQGVVAANTRLKGNMSELSGPLKLRYADNNMAIRTTALDIISKIAAAMGKQFEPIARAFAASVTPILGDAKAPMRIAGTSALQAMAEASGVAPLISGFGSVLETKAANPALRQELFTWLATWFEAHPPEKGLDLQPLALSAVQTLDEKLAAVRKAAQAVLPYIIMRCGYKFVVEQTNSLKPAQKSSVLPLIDAAKSEAAAKAPKAAPPPAAPAAKPPSKALPARASGVAALARASTSVSPAASPSSKLNGASAPASRPASALSRPSSVKPPTAVGRSLKAPSASRPQSVLSSDDVFTDRAPSTAIKSRIGAPSSRKPSAVQEKAVDKSLPFISADIKYKAARERKEGRGQQWIGPDATPRPELSEVLRSHCEQHLSASLVDSLFSKDHNAERDFLSALTLISDFTSSPEFVQEEYGLSDEETAARVIANADLVFKYVALRLTDNNTSIFLKCLDVLDHLVNALREQQYHMSDYEANSILPCLVGKFGDPKVAFRDRIRDIFRRLAFIFPPSKILSHFVENGLPSKNAKVRMECLTELGFLFSKHGLQVCTPAKTLPIIAKQISDRDASVRNAALLALGEAYQIVGEEVWKHVGSLPPKEKSLLEERLKRTAAPPVRQPSSASNRQSMLPASAKPAGPSRLARPSSTNSAASGVSGIVPPGAAASRMRMPSGIARPGSRAFAAPASSDAPSTSAKRNSGAPATSASGTHDLDDEEGSVQGDVDAYTVEQTVNEVLSSDPERSVEALKSIERFMHEVQPAMPEYADRFGVVITKQLHRVFASPSDPGIDRLKKHLLIAATTFFDLERGWNSDASPQAEGDAPVGRPLGNFVTRTTFVSLLTELLQRLIECSRDGETLQQEGKYINIVVLRSFSTCRLNVLFGGSLSMLVQAAEDMAELQGEVLKRRTQFAELIMKCLWKIARRLPEELRGDALDAPELLAEVETFLQTIPPSEWRRRGSENLPLGQLPLRTIKAILGHFVEVYGENVFSLLENLQDPEESHVYSYLYRLVYKDAQPQTEDAAVTEEADRAEAEFGSSAVARKSLNVTSPPMSPSVRSGGPRLSAPADDDPADMELKTIFAKISKKDESREGIHDLYLFQKKYPQKESAIERGLENTGQYFQRYIKRALANHAAADPDAASRIRGESVNEAEQATAVASPVPPPTTASARSSLASPVLPTDRHDSLTRKSVLLSDIAPPPSPSSHQRVSSHSDERLAQLRAKFSQSRNPSEQAQAANS
ncbi:Microtubule-associated protein [Ceraceosorus bombacis]|uniref:Microtubule-associated protein n=1 Tax=Ceraceosorus bombacis TaxID=401625 RepID=A0A0P1BBV0_9BASI|nr:Microtubule-associated protein [Ceraceosorus bombacis]